MHRDRSKDLEETSRNCIDPKISPEEYIKFHNPDWVYYRYRFCPANHCFVKAAKLLLYYFTRSIWKRTSSLLFISSQLSIKQYWRMEIQSAVEEKLTSDVSATSVPVPAPISKNQAKRLIKEEHRRLSKLKKKDASKKRKLESSLAGDEKSGSTDDVSKKTTDEPVFFPPHDGISKKDRKQKELEEYTGKCAKNFSVIIDCAWEDKHNESTLKSLTQQIMFCYGINRRHDCPAHMYMTGVGPLVTANLNKSNFSHWNGVTIVPEDYIGHPDFSTDPQPHSNGGTPTNQKQLVYLTSDAEETLETLDPNCAYIIGGIVDRNRHKFATFNKAKAQNVRMAKLPIKENFALAATHILTVNHVYHILLNYAKYQCWVQAIKEVMPNRKCPVEKESADAGAEKTTADGTAETETTSISGDDKVDTITI